MVKIFKLLSGANVLAEVEEGKEGVWGFPFFLVSTPRAGGGMDYNLTAFVEENKDLVKEVTIKNIENKILISYEPDAKVYNFYKTVVKKIRMQISGIVEPNQRQKSNILV